MVWESGEEEQRPAGGVVVVQAGRREAWTKVGEVGGFKM